MKNKIKPKGCIIGKDEFGKDFIAHCGCVDCINRSEALLDLRKGYLEQINKIAELEAQIEKMKCCGNCKYYQFLNDAGYRTCIKDGKRNGKNYRSCEFNLEKWEGR